MDPRNWLQKRLDQRAARQSDAKAVEAYKEIQGYLNSDKDPEYIKAEISLVCMRTSKINEGVNRAVINGLFELMSRGLDEQLSMRAFEDIIAIVNNTYFPNPPLEVSFEFPEEIKIKLAGLIDSNPTYREYLINPSNFNVDMPFDLKLSWFYRIFPERWTMTDRHDYLLDKIKDDRTPEESVGSLVMSFVRNIKDDSEVLNLDLELLLQELANRMERMDLDIEFDDARYIFRNLVLGFLTLTEYLSNHFQGFDIASANSLLESIMEVVKVKNLQVYNVISKSLFSDEG